MRTIAKTIVLYAAAASSIALAVQAGAQEAVKGDAQAARTKVSMCIGCHGIPMYRTAYPEVYSVPKIGGQSPEYIAAALRAYRSGERSHPSMIGIAKGLSDADIADLAQYYGAKR